MNDAIVMVVRTSGHRSMSLLSGQSKSRLQLAFLSISSTESGSRTRSRWSCSRISHFSLSKLRKNDACLSTIAIGSPYTSTNGPRTGFERPCLMFSRSTMLTSPDRPLLDVLRRHGPLTVDALCEHLGVTATAVRHRLTRLCDQGLVERHQRSRGRGRPSYLYQVSAETRGAFGQDYESLAFALWKELADSDDDHLRQAVMDRMVDRMAARFRNEVNAESFAQRIEQLRACLENLGVEAEVTMDEASGLPSLQLHSCPYDRLAREDASICQLERATFERVLSHPIEVNHCQCDGHRCCGFSAKTDASTHTTG